MRSVVSLLILFAMISNFACGPSVTEEQLLQEIEKYKQEEELVKATKAMETFVEKFPESTHRPTIMKDLAILYVGSAKDYRKAIEMYTRIQNEYPTDSALVAQCQFMTGYIYANDLKEYDHARRIYEDFLKRFPNSDLADDVQWELKYLGKDLSEIDLFPSENKTNGKSSSVVK